MIDAAGYGESTLLEARTNFGTEKRKIYVGRGSERDASNYHEPQKRNTTDRETAGEKIRNQTFHERRFGRRVTPNIAEFIGHVVTPPNGSNEAAEQNKAAKYRLDCFVISDDAYDAFMLKKRKQEKEKIPSAFQYGATIYLREHFRNDALNVSAVEHEATHIMRCVEYPP